MQKETTAIFILALIPRLIYLAQMASASPFIQNEVGDSTIYIAQAEAVLRGDLLAGNEVFFHSSPIYIYFLALIFGVFGKGLLAVRLIQVLIGSMSCVLLYLLARRFFGRETGIVTGVMAALYGFFIFSDADVLAINLVIFFTLGSFLALVAGHEKGRADLIALSGILLGLSALGKPDMLLLAPVGFFWLFFAGRKRADFPPGRPYILCLALFLSVTMTILPVTIRNYIVEKDLVLITSNGGVNFFIGNNAEATGMFGIPAGAKIHNDARFYHSTFTVPQEKTGRKMLPSEVSGFWFHKGLEFFLGRPWEAAKILGLKFLLFWNWYEIPNHHDYYYAKEYLSSLLKMPFVLGFALLAPLALLGIFLAFRREGRPDRTHLFLLLAFIFIPMCTTVAFFVTARYRLPAVTFLFPFAGYAVYRLYLMAMERDWHKPAMVAALVLASIFVNMRLPGFDKSIGIANEHDDAASLFYKQGKYREAAAMYERALTWRHDEALLNYKLGGIYHMKLRETGKAYEAFKRSAAQAPNNIDAALSLGATALELGRVDEAEKEFKKILKLEPTYTRALINLGVVYNQTGRAPDALPLLMQAVQKEPMNVNALINLGYSCLLLKDWRNAVFYLDTAVRLDPSSAIARFDLAEALANIGEKARAREQFGEVIRLTPEGSSLGDKAREELSRLGGGMR